MLSKIMTETNAFGSPTREQNQLEAMCNSYCALWLLTVFGFAFKTHGSVPQLKLFRISFSKVMTTAAHVYILHHNVNDEAEPFKDSQQSSEQEYIFVMTWQWNHVKVDDFMLDESFEWLCYLTWIWHPAVSLDPKLPHRGWWTFLNLVPVKVCIQIFTKNMNFKKSEMQPDGLSSDTEALIMKNSLSQLFRFSHADLASIRTQTWSPYYKSILI